MSGKPLNGKNNPKALLWLLKNSKPHIFTLAILTLIGVLISVFSFMFAISSKNVIDAASGVIATYHTFNPSTCS